MSPAPPSSPAPRPPCRTASRADRQIAGPDKRISSTRSSNSSTTRAQQQQYVQQAPPPAPAGPDTITQLKELAELKTQGILTEAEFEAQKAKVLAAS